MTDPYFRTFSECCACNMSNKNNHFWRDSMGYSCMNYSITPIFCGAYDPPGGQSAWEACPTFCRKSDIRGIIDWVDTQNQSCLFYQEKVTLQSIVLKSLWNEAERPNYDLKGHELVSGSGFCGFFDGNIPASFACDVCHVGRECQPDINWRDRIGLGCASYAEDAQLWSPTFNWNQYIFISCGVYDWSIPIYVSSWEACPCYCNWTQELLNGERYPGWTDIRGLPCYSYENSKQWCGVFDWPLEYTEYWPGGKQSAFDGCPYACNRSEIKGNQTWTFSRGGYHGYTCLWFQYMRDRFECGQPGAIQNCDYCSELEIGDYFFPWYDRSQQAWMNVSCGWIVDYYPPICYEDISAMESCEACWGDFRRLNNSRFGRFQKDRCVRGIVTTYFSYDVEMNTCFQLAKNNVMVAGIGWNSTVRYCSLHATAFIPDFDWEATTYINNQTVECFIREKSMGFCTVPTLRGVPNAECDCNDGDACIFAPNANCEVACEDSSGVLDIGGPALSVRCRCSLGICEDNILEDWKLGKDGKYYETMYYFGNNESNGWMGINALAQTCFKPECPDMIACLTEPSGLALDYGTCNYYNFYNTFAVVFCGIFVILISFTGLTQRDNAENLKLCFKCQQDEEDSCSDQSEKLVDIAIRNRGQNTKLRLEASRTVVLQFVDYIVDIWCAIDYWGKNKPVLGLLTVSTIVFQICITTIMKQPWKNGGWLMPGIFYYTGLGLVHECCLLWNLSEYTVDLKRMVFIATLTEDIPSVAINISGIVAGNYLPLLQTVSLFISMILINKSILQYLTYYHRETLVITTGYNLLFIGPFIITDELLRVTAVFVFFRKAGLIHIAALIFTNLALGGFFGWIFVKRSTSPPIYFFTYMLIMPLSCVLSLYALLLHEPNGNIFFVEYFTRLCLNVALFSISCWGKAVEMPQQFFFTIVLWMNVIFLIGITATLSRGILSNRTFHQNVLSVHEIDPKNGILFLSGMAPRISQQELDIISGDGECSSLPMDDLEEESEMGESVEAISSAAPDDERCLSSSEFPQDPPIKALVVSSPNIELQTRIVSSSVELQKWPN